MSRFMARLVFVAALLLSSALANVEAYAYNMPKAALEGCLFDTSERDLIFSSEELLTQKDSLPRQTVGLGLPDYLLEEVAKEEKVLVAENWLALASVPPCDNRLVDEKAVRVQTKLWKAILSLNIDDAPQVVVWTLPEQALAQYAVSLGVNIEFVQSIRDKIAEINQGIRMLDYIPRLGVVDLSKVLTKTNLNEQR